MKKVSSAFLMAISLTASDGRYDDLFLNNYATINLLDRIGSIPGVGDSRLAASQNYGMRIWANPGQDGEAGADRDRHLERDSGAEPAESGGRHRAVAGAARAPIFSIR